MSEFQLSAEEPEVSGGMAVHERAPDGKDEWLTPPHVLQALGEFDLDPCAPLKRPWEMAREHFTWRDNGLLKPWVGRVWLNPPYGAETGKWLRRLAEHGNGVSLVFARTETALWFEHVWARADAVLFLRGRLTFHHVDGRPGGASAGAPSALIAYGGRNVMALKASGLPGHLVRLRGEGARGE